MSINLKKARVSGLKRCCLFNKSWKKKKVVWIFQTLPSSRHHKNIDEKMNHLHQRLLNYTSDNFYTGELPKAQQLYLPWNWKVRGISNRDPTMVKYRFIGFQTKLKRLARPAADVTLMPSPGEEFSLTIRCMDGFLNTIDQKLSVQVLRCCFQSYWSFGF